MEDIAIMNCEAAGLRVLWPVTSASANAVLAVATQMPPLPELDITRTRGLPTGTDLVKG